VPASIVAAACIAASTSIILGSPFASLFMLRVGCFKTALTRESGRFRVTGVRLPGEMVGLDGLESRRHACDAMAREDGGVCTLPFGALQRLALEAPQLQHHPHRILSAEIVREQEMMPVLAGRT
jgi:CRP/FNR family transcriptional regulator